MEYFVTEWDMGSFAADDDMGSATACLERAVCDLTEKIRRRPSAEAYLERGNAYFAEERFEQAIDDYTMAIRLDPRLAAAYYSRGLVHREKGDLARSAADLATAYRLDPDYME